MAHWRPFTARVRGDARFEELVEDIPPHSKSALIQWVRPFLIDVYDGDKGNAPQIANALHLLGPRGAPIVSVDDLLKGVLSDDDSFLNLLDYFLAFEAEGFEAERLSEILGQGGSAWTVRSSSTARYELFRRVPGPVQAALDDLPGELRSVQLLAESWTHLMGRNPNPSAAFRESIRAIEAAARPVISPNDSRATLGKMIAAMRDNPSRWSVDLVEASIGGVCAMCEMVWRSQFDRHGTDDESVPLTVAQSEAESAFYIALALVQQFSTGHVTDSRRADS